MKKVIYFILVFGAVACKSKEEKIKPQITNLTESVYSSVTLQPDSLYEVYASVNGILDHFFVGDGELVKMGDPIAQIINTTPKLNADNARIALELAQQNASRKNRSLRICPCPLLIEDQSTLNIGEHGLDSKSALLSIIKKSL